MSNLPVPVPPALPSETVIITPSPGTVSRRRPGCTGCFGCGAVIAVTLIIAAAVIVLALILGGSGTINAVIGGIRSIFVPQTTATVGSTQTIVTSIAPLSRLVTISAQLARADVPVQVTAGALNACGYSAYHVVQGTIEAGVDLSRMRPEDIVLDAARDAYVLTVPSPQYTNCSIDYSRQYQQSFTTCVADWDAVRILAEYTTMQALIQDTFEGGLLERAGAEATGVLSGFVTALTGKPVEIIFDPSRQPPIPDQCERTPPPGWTFDAVSGQWRK